MLSAPGVVLLFTVLLGFSSLGLASETNDLDIYSFYVNSTVSSRYAVTVITSRVANRANESHEVDFHVELPKNAFISKFTMTIDGKAYDGVVKKKEEAQQQYSRAVSRGESAGLVSVVGRKLEEFKTSVTVAAHSKVSFELTYEELLKRRLGKYELLIKAKPKQVVKDFKIDVRIFERQGISFLETKGGLASNDLESAVSTSKGDKEALVNFSPSVEQQKQCSGCAEKGLSGELLVIYDVNRPKSAGDLQVVNGYFVHYFAPTGLSRIPKNVVFIIDQSGSMSGTKMKQTREAMLKILDDLYEEDHFGLITFDGSVTTWKDNLVPVNSDYLALARTFVKKINSRGMTDIHAAVLKGVEMLSRFGESGSPKGSTSIIILLTDGDPTSGVTNLGEIQANVRDAIRERYTFYCLGFGFDVNFKFLETMALENGGLARRIYEDSDAALQLQGFYEEVATPLLLEVQMKYSGALSTTQTSFGQYYDGSEIVVAGQITDNDLEKFTAEVKAKMKDNDVTFSEEITQSKGDSKTLDHYIFDTYIQRLWAYLTVQQLLEKQVLLTEEQQVAVREQVLALSLNYSFVTPLTSMVVTKPEGEQAQVAHKPKEGEAHSKPVVSFRSSQKSNTAAYPSVRLLNAGDPCGPRGFGSSADAVDGVRPKSRAGKVRTHRLRQGSASYDHHPLVFRSFSILHQPPTAKNFLQKPTYASPTLVTVIKVLLPTQGQNTSICFDVEAQTNRIPRNPVLTLLYDPATGISITGEMLQGQHLHTIGVRHKDGCFMKANTTAIVVTQEEIESVFSWADLGMSHRCDGITLNLHDEVLLVEMGKVHLRILRHKDGQSNFLWTAISLQAPIPGAKGLLGNSPISYVLKETTSTISAKLEILGKEVMGRRVSAVDYSIHSKPTVDCWLVPFSSVVPGSLQDVLSS